ncbi:MAG: T9SS type A sorting domain-containing protein [Vicingus serpentipes]|nr:T9SS type A sorting domain-containing protein [Vicingus serpentipes]
MKKFKKIIIGVLWMLISVIPFEVFSQEINGYAKVTSVAGSVLTLSNVDEAFDSFEDGEQIIIMQMQDDVIGSNTGNDASFGDLGDIQSAGLYEVLTVVSHTESGGLPTTITVSGNFLNTYNTGVNSSLQIITYPTFGSPDYTTTADMSAKSWDGNTGGIIAFNVNGVLTLAHNIDADDAGFRGATANGGGSTGCTGASNYRIPSTDNHADKGEGIYKVTDINYAAGRAKILNGGGGGNSHNAGGGGGSNFSSGGLGGPGWPNCTPTAGGMGGVDLSSYVTANRIFMGGGGGSGEGNNGGSQNAGNGAGIILIKANEIRTSGSCGGLSITANGESITTGSGGDGNSAGGAGGSLIFQVGSWSIAGTCPLTIQSNGGNGGDVTHSDGHGAGGGGGMGTVIFSSAQPSANVTINTTPGAGGRNCNTCDYAETGTGTDGGGIVQSSSGPLPVTLIQFEANVNEDRVELKWVTATEINSDYFVIERSKDGKDWKELLTTSAAGNSHQTITYFEVDYNPHKGTSYYRLKQVDFDGSYEYFSIVPVKFLKNSREKGINVFPNPFVKGKEKLRIQFNNLMDQEAFVVLRDMKGQEFYSKVVLVYEENQIVAIPIDINLPRGTYLVIASSENEIYSQKLIVK